MISKFTCTVCKQSIEHDNGGAGGTGYGIDKDGGQVCYACCAVQDTERMRKENKITLYLTKENVGYSVSNWPGTLKIKAEYVRKGNHNIARTRYDVWFNHAGKRWHGVQYGENTQICHCQAVA
jgi:hypothetical protein